MEQNVGIATRLTRLMGLRILGLGLVSGGHAGMMLIFEARQLILSAWIRMAQLRLFLPLLWRHGHQQSAEG